MRWKALEPSARLRLALAVVVVVVATFAACTACGRRAPGGPEATAAREAGDGGAAAERLVEDAAALRAPIAWESANAGEAEDLAALAVDEGAMGLVEAAAEPALRGTAIRAMGYARGWAQLPFLARVASGRDDDEARLALDATLELAARPRSSEDPEDEGELREGCVGMLTLARDVARPRPRRVAAVRALRMLPCPPEASGEALPADVDAK